MSTTTKRLTPTRDTLRRLYLLSGNQCAFPECKHPIIIEDGTYIGELCHICAAAEGGERFDPTQTNEDRRQFENLLLMCHDHHVVTNDEVEFPVERMRQIKAYHELKFERGLSSMLESAGLQITNSSVSLGGEGGKAPGAGGGGGGAIGEGATGGDGGPGGRIWDISELNIVEICDALIDETVPGAGGGGSSAIGKGAVGGDGGGGGDAVSAKFDLTKLKRIGIESTKVRVGKGGSVGRDGQSSGIDFLDERDNVILSVNAPGGIKGGGSTMSTDPSPTHQMLKEKQPALLCAMLANSVEIRDGLLFVLGGGWSYYTCPHIPYDTVWPIVIQVTFGCIQAMDSINLSLVVVNPLQKKVLTEEIALVHDYSNSSSVHTSVLPLSVKITMPGIWKISINLGTLELANIPLEIIDSRSVVEQSY